MKPKAVWVVLKEIFEPVFDFDLWERVREVNGKRRRMCKAKESRVSIECGNADKPDPAVQ